MANAAVQTDNPKPAFYRNVPKSSPLYAYAQLSAEAKTTALAQSLEIEIAGHRLDMAETRSLALNQRINSRHHIAKHVRNARHIRNLKNDVAKHEKVIIENLCVFLDDGTYVLYSEKIYNYFLQN